MAALPRSTQLRVIPKDFSGLDDPVHDFHRSPDIVKGDAALNLVQPPTAEVGKDDLHSKPNSLRISVNGVSFPALRSAVPAAISAVSQASYPGAGVALAAVQSSDGIGVAGLFMGGKVGGNGVEINSRNKDNGS